MLDSIFQKTNYRQYLREKLAQSGGRGLITKVAEAAQCQRSHLSRVLSEQLHLTMEQGFRVGRFFNMGRDEEAYFLKLIEYERSGDRDYGAKLKRELNEMRDAQQDLAKRTSEPSLQNTELETLYYSSWFWSAIHIIVSIPKFQKTAQIAMRLNLAPSFVESCLKKLEEFDLVQRAGDSWQISSGGLHLKKNSPMNGTQHSNWRARAVLDSQLSGDDSIHYTVVQSISESDFERIKQLLLRHIDEYVRIARPSKEEELICFTCDLFRV